VRLIDDDRVVGFKQGVCLRFSQQNAVGHQLNRGVFGQAILESNLVAHHITQRRVQLSGNPFGHATGGDASGLRMPNQAAAVDTTASQCQRHLGQLRRLT